MVDACLCILHYSYRGSYMANLTAKQSMFCKEYLIDLNATQAAIRAGYSEKTATKIGSENLTKPDIATQIQQLAEERSKRVTIDADWVLVQAVDMFKVCKEAGELNPAKGFLELAGKHCTINAFKDHVDVNARVNITEITRKIV